MNKIYYNFLVTHAGENYHLTRLNDRSKRRNLKVHRKDVYLVKVTSKSNFVLLHFSNEYKTIYHNFLAARDVLGNKVLGDEWKIGKENLLILLPYLGSAFNLPNQKTLSSIVSFLKETNEPSSLKVFETPRYITNLISLNENSISTNLKRIIQLIHDRKMRFNYGPGVEDPSINNFTRKLKRTYLVDLDNFTTNINLDYELGFLAADINLEYRDLKNKLEKWLSIFESLTAKKIDKIQFCFGYISRLGTVLIDSVSGENVLADLLDGVTMEIEGLSLELLKTLE